MLQLTFRSAEYQPEILKAELQPEKSISQSIMQKKFGSGV